MISEQIKELRKLSERYTVGGHRHVGYKLKQAADTIEFLSRRQQEAKKMNYDAFNIIEKMTEEIENCYGGETELTKRARECLDRKGYSSRWIPCEDRLPENNDNVLVCWGGDNVSVGYFVSGGAGG